MVFCCPSGVNRKIYKESKLSWTKKNETANRAERPLIEPEKLKEYRKRRQEMSALYESRLENLKGKYSEQSNA